MVLPKDTYSIRAKTTVAPGTDLSFNTVSKSYPDNKQHVRSGTIDENYSHIVTSPQGFGVTKRVLYIQVYNPDVINHEVTFALSNTEAGSTKIILTVILEPGWAVEFSDKERWLIYDEEGRRIANEVISSVNFVDILGDPYDNVALGAALDVIQDDIDAHESNVSNPHGVTKAQVGLGNADNTSDVNKPVSTAQAAADAVVLASAETYADGLVVGLWDDRGNFDASVNAYPSSGGSGTAGAILKGDIWTISVVGTLPTGQVVEIGDTVRALVDTPGNTQANWAISQQNIGYTAENSANKTDTAAGNTTSSTLYLSVKGYYDYLIGLVWLTDLIFGTWISGLTGKTTPVDADYSVIMDSADSNKAKKLSWANIKATLKTYLDPFYILATALATPTAGTIGYVPNKYFIRQHAARSLTSTTGVQKLFDTSANGALTLPLGTYTFEAQIYLSDMSGTSGNYTPSLAGTAVLAGVFMHIWGYDNAPITTTINQNGQAAATASFSGNVHTASVAASVVSRISGSFEVTTTGTVIPSVALTTAAAATVNVGTIYTFECIGPNTVVTAGPWS